MSQSAPDCTIFEEKNIWRVLLHIAPPVMLALLIQAMYNLVDSFFVGRFSGDGLTALSVIYPIQYLITALSVGTGIGVNTKMSQDYARGRGEEAAEVAGTGTLLALLSWAVFALGSLLFLKPYAASSATSPLAVEYTLTYGYIVCIGSLSTFLEGIWSKIHQAGGNMRLPMLAQISGALLNILLDPIFIFGWGPVPAMGIAGAAIATVLGQTAAALITVSAFRMPPELFRLPEHICRIYQLGYPAILRQVLSTAYIVVLNLILSSFCDQAVTVLGLYYKIQSFLFIPLTALQTCIVPLLSYTYAGQKYERCLSILYDTMLTALFFMTAGAACMELLPAQLLGLFVTNDPLLFEIGVPAFRMIAVSFFPAVLSLILPVFFQAIGISVPSLLLTMTRQLFCLIPVFWLLSGLGLGWTWAAFPISETITGLLGLYFLRKKRKKWGCIRPLKSHIDEKGECTMRLITAVISKKDSEEVCRFLSEHGFYFTKIASSGGFLSSGNTTLLIGTADVEVKEVLGIIRDHCSKRVETITSTAQLASHSVSNLSEVVVGGAAVFVSKVDAFQKM